ncbi:UBN2 domain-containing protein [Tanacetum coccineum]
MIPEEESIDNAFAKSNTIITSLKALDEGFSSKNCVRKISFRALYPKWRVKVTTIEESKNLTTLPLDELIGNLKVYEEVINKDSNNGLRQEKNKVESWIYVEKGSKGDEDSSARDSVKTKIEESLNVTFDETPPPPKTSPLEDDELVEEEAIESAFLTFINERFVAQPLGFIDFAKPNYVYRLKKALYGLKQASKACGGRSGGAVVVVAVMAWRWSCWSWGRGGSGVAVKMIGECGCGGVLMMAVLCGSARCGGHSGGAVVVVAVMVIAVVAAMMRRWRRDGGSDDDVEVEVRMWRLLAGYGGRRAAVEGDDGVDVGR